MTINIKDLEKQVEERGRLQTLDNGITVISENVPGSGLVTGEILLHVGFCNEQAEDQGIMHFLEHMSFGESRLSEDRITGKMQAGMIGLDINASTGPQSITYPIKGANSLGYILQDNFVEAFKIVSDKAFYPQITEESRLKERPIIQRERIERKEKEEANPYHKISREIDAKVYGNNQHLRKEGLGTEESIDRITIKKLRHYHSKYFVGNNTIVSVVGDLSNLEEDVIRMLKKIPAGEKTEPLKLEAEEPYVGRERLEFKLPVQGSTDVSIYFQTPGHGSPDSYAIHMLSHILGGSINSLLFQDIREQKGLVYSINSGVDGHRKTGLLKIRYAVDPKDLDDSLQAVDDNIKKLKNGEFNPLLVDVFKAAYLPNVLSRLQVPGWICTELTDRNDREKFGFEFTGLQKLEASLNLTSKDIVEAANKYLGENRLTIVIQ